MRELFSAFTLAPALRDEQRDKIRRITAMAGVVGPALFGIIVLSLTIAQYSFLRTLGWDPLRAPTFDWPSGLSLGPLGWLMTATFLLNGALMSIFAFGLRLALPNKTGQIGSILLIWAGIAMMGLAFSTDKTNSLMPTTWHGRLHDLSFMALGLMLIPALIVLAFSFREFTNWKRLSGFTWIVAGLAVPTFAVKGMVFYAFLIAMLAWSEVAAVYLSKTGRGAETRDPLFENR